jgi:hypothetical protein
MATTQPSTVSTTTTDYASGRWTEILSAEALETALSLARGEYQRALVLGYESLSGSTLRGKASRYGARYAESRRNLLRRLEEAGLLVDERRAERGRRILVLQ